MGWKPGQSSNGKVFSIPLQVELEDQLGSDRSAT